MYASRFVVCLVILSIAGAVQAGEPLVAASVDVPPQLVELEDGSLAGFELQAKVFQDQRASGRLTLALGRDVLLEYDVISGIAFRDTRTDEVSVMLFLHSTSGGADFAVAVATPDPDVPGCDIWDFASNGVWPRATFPAEGEITLVHGDPDPIEGDGAPDVALIDAPLQVVEISEILRDVTVGHTFLAGFEARVHVLQNHRTIGFVEITPDGHDPIEFEPVFGAVIGDTGPTIIILLPILGADSLGLGDLVIATVREDPAIPGCDIWDFTSNVIVRFEATGEIRILP